MTPILKCDVYGCSLPAREHQLAGRADRIVHLCVRHFGEVSPSPLPDPRRYARMTQIERGAAVAPLTIEQAWQFARQYAAFLDTILDGTNVTTDPRAVFGQVLVCAYAWRAEQARPVGCDVAGS
jgi:predicted dehydrogenase